MSDTTTIELAELRALIARMDALLTPELRAAVDSAGNPGAVASGELIESAWGNAVKDRVVQRYSTDAALLAAPPTPHGQMAVSTEGLSSLYMRTPDLGWQRALTRGWANGTFSAPTTGGNASMNFYEGKNIAAQDSWGMRVLVEGVYVIVANAMFTGVGNQSQVHQISIALYNPSNTSTPYAAIPAFTAPGGTFWSSVTVVAVRAMSKLDFMRLAAGGDVPGATIDNRSTWHMARIASY